MFHLNLNDNQKAYLRYSFRGAIAALIAIIIADSLHLRQNYWVLFGTITVLKFNVGASFQRGKQRLLGTLFGVIISIAVAVLMLHWHINPVFCVPFLVLLAVYYFWQYTITIFFITLIFVIFFGINASDPFGYGINRLLDTSLGIVIAMIISMYVWPNKVSSALDKDLTNFLKLNREVFGQLAEAYCQQGVDLTTKRKEFIRVDKLYEKLQTDLVFIEHEPGHLLTRRQQIRLELNLDRLRGVVGSMGYLAIHAKKIILPQVLLAKLTEIVDEVLQIIEHEKSPEQLKKLEEDLVDKIYKVVTFKSNHIDEQNLPVATRLSLETYLYTLKDYVQLFTLLLTTLTRVRNNN